MLTVADLLTRPNPDFSEAQPVYKKTDRRRGSSRRNNKWPLLTTLKKWMDFDIENLNRIFNGGAKAVLEERMDICKHSELLNLDQQGFNGEESLRSVLDITHRAIVNRALKDSSRHVIKQDLRMLRGDGASLYLLTRPDAEKAWPDWASRSSMFGKHCILPGETKTSWTWTSADLGECVNKRGEVYHQTAEALWPLRQLAYYCVLSFARYGFMITNKELIVIKISCGQRPNIPNNAVLEWREYVEDDMTVEYQSIPWKHSPEKTRVMTMNLGLWFLHLLAGNNGQLCATSPESLGDEVYVEFEEKVPFDDELVDSQSQSQPSQTSDEEVTQTSDMMMVESEDQPGPGFEGDVIFSTLAFRSRERSPAQSTNSDTRGSFSHRVNDRGTRNEARGVLSPNESNVRIQKRRKPSQKGRKGI